MSSLEKLIEGIKKPLESGKMGETAKDNVPMLIEALRDEDAAVSQSAAQALGAIGESAKDAVPALIERLDDENSSIRIAAADALAVVSPGKFSDISGVWNGEATQGEIGWTIRVTIENDKYSIDYPSLDCGGDLIEIKKEVAPSATRKMFRETLKYGKDNCIDNGTIILTKVTPNKLLYSWHSLTDGKREVAAVLTR